MRLGVVIPREAPLPAELLAEVDGAFHRAGDMLMATSAVSCSLRRSQPLEQIALPALAALAEEGRLFAKAIETLSTRIEALKARAEP